MAPRGIRLNNPGNIRLSNQAWLGQADEQSDPDFVTFKAPTYGIRALAKTLTTYQVAHGCGTLRQIISRWAPTNENDTDAYLIDVAHRCGVDPDAAVDVHVESLMLDLVKAIITHENGCQPYSDVTLGIGLHLAGIGVPEAAA